METKPSYKSVGFWGIIITAALEAAEKAGGLPAGISPVIITILQAIAMAATLFGRWRATQPLSVK